MGIDSFEYEGFAAELQDRFRHGLLEDMDDSWTLVDRGRWKIFAFSDAAMGCHAEYKCMSQEGAVVHKPSSLSYGEAAALSFGGTTALDFL